MSGLSQLVRETSQEPTPFVKAINYAAALLGAGTFLGLVNLTVGVLSAIWLAMQAYGFIYYELPRRKRQKEADARQKILDELQTEIKRRELAKLVTRPGGLDDEG